MCQPRETQTVVFRFAASALSESSLDDGPIPNRGRGGGARGIQKSVFQQTLQAITMHAEVCTLLASTA